MKKKFFFHQILLTYSVVVCALVFLVFSAFMFYLKTSEQKRLMAKQEKNITGCIENCESEFSYMYNMIESVKNLSSFDRVALCAQEEYYKCMTDLFDDLRKFDKLISDKGYHMVVHKLNEETAVTNAGTRNINYILKDIGISTAQYKQLLQNASSENIYRENYIWTDDMLVFVSEKDFIDRRMIVTLYAPVQKLLPFSAAAKANLHLLFDDAKVTDLRSATHPSIDLPQSIIEGSLRHLQTAQVAQGNYNFIKSSYLDLYYAYSTDVFSVNDLMVFVLQMLAALVAICIVSYLIVRSFSVKIYRPIDQLFHTFAESDIEIEKTDAKNEIEYMTHRVTQIRRNNQELAQKLEINNQLLREKFLYNILVGRISENEAALSLKKYNLEWLNGPIAVVLFQFAPVDESDGTLINPALETLAPILEPRLHKKTICHRVLSEAMEVCFLIQMTEDTMLQETLGSFINTMDTEMGLLLCAFTGPVSTCLKELPFALSGARRLKENQDRLPLQNLYSWSDIALLPRESIVYPMQMEAEMLSALERGADLEVDRILETIFDTYLKRGFDDFELRDMIIFALTNTINRALEQGFEADMQISSRGKYLFLELRSCESVEELKLYVQRQLKNVLDAIHHRNAKKGIDLQRALEQYIAQNYQQDISLLDMAGYFNLSPTYMSVIFKNTMGNNFKDYITQIRFQHAEKLLQAHPEMKLVTLGEQVGITNTNTLIRMFKKFTGLAPGQYIRNYMKNRPQ